MQHPPPAGATLTFSILLLEHLLSEALQMLFLKCLENKKSAAFWELKLSGVGEPGLGSRGGCESLGAAAMELIRTPAASQGSGMSVSAWPASGSSTPGLDIPGAVGCLASQDEMGH